MVRRVIGLCIAASVTATLGGCAKNMLTRDHYNLIKDGVSTKLEVRQTMGDKYAEYGDQWRYEDEDRFLTVVFYFDSNDRVLRKEWIDAETGEWDGAAPGINPNPEGRQMSSEGRSSAVKEGG